MKKIAAVVAVIAVMVGVAYAAQVNPTSNVLGDTAATANTLVYRDGNGVFDAASLQDGTIITAKLASSAVSTAKMWLDQPTFRVACILTNKQLGTCTNGIVTTTGLCNCS